MSQDVDYDGTIGIQARFAGMGDAPVTGTLHASLTDAQLRHHLSNAREERYAFGTGVVDATATPDVLAVKVGLDAGKSGSINGRLDVRRAGEEWSQFPIKGELALETDGLALLDVYVPGIDRAAGRLTTRVSVSGTLGAPEFLGELQVRDASSISTRSTSRCAGARRRAFQRHELELEASARAGDGTGRINGQLTWRDRQPYGHLHLEGTNLRLVNVPEAHIFASPNLDFEIAGNRVDVSGEVKLPTAQLEPATITNAVLSSSDEVLVGAQQNERAEHMQVVTDLTLTLGDHVTIDSFGLKARITGSIKAHSDESQVSRGTGEFDVAEGKYAAFGRNLDISRGRLIFSNGSLDDPGIDLRAQKVFPDVTAGVNVRGSLRSPRMTFFSEPAIPQSQIVSLILGGGSLEGVQSNNRSNAAVNAGLAQGGAMLAQQFGSRSGCRTSASRRISPMPHRWCWAGTSRHACTSATASASRRRSTP